MVSGCDVDDGGVGPGMMEEYEPRGRRGAQTVRIQTIRPTAVLGGIAIAQHRAPASGRRAAVDERVTAV